MLRSGEAASPVRAKQHLRARLRDCGRAESGFRVAETEAPNLPRPFRDCEQELLLPPSLSEWLAEDHLAWFVLDAASEVDLGAFYASYRCDGWGTAAHDPQMMVALLVYASAIGERSSRGIERRCREDVAFGVITAITSTRAASRVSTRWASRTVWKLSRETADFSPLDFAQRFNATLSDDGRTIAGAWEIRHDGKPWELDFKLT